MSKAYRSYHKTYAKFQPKPIDFEKPKWGPHVLLCKVTLPPAFGKQLMYAINARYKISTKSVL